MLFESLQSHRIVGPKETKDPSLVKEKKMMIARSSITKTKTHGKERKEHIRLLWSGSLGEKNRLSSPVIRRCHYNFVINVCNETYIINVNNDRVHFLPD